MIQPYRISQSLTQKKPFLFLYPITSVPLLLHLSILLFLPYHFIFFLDSFPFAKSNHIRILDERSSSTFCSIAFAFIKCIYLFFFFFLISSLPLHFLFRSLFHLLNQITYGYKMHLFFLLNSS